MFNLKSFFNFAAKTKLNPRPTNITERPNGSRYFAHVERNKYAPWGRGVKLEGATKAIQP
jgi:hypothetical protein